MKLIVIDGKPGVDDGYYDGCTSERARKPQYVLSLLEERRGVDLEAISKNTRDNYYVAKHQRAAMATAAE